MENLSGSIIIDNTTIYGASKAYKTRLNRFEDWYQEINLVNIRSLIDLLETIVLNENILVDISSTNALNKKIDYDRDIYFNAVQWKEMEEINDNNDSILKTHLFDENIVFLAINLSLNKLINLLHNGYFLRRNYFELNNYNVPNFYNTPVEFKELLLKCLPQNIPQDIKYSITEAENNLKMVSNYESNYAMFAFRGFYYQELANILSLSYLPHTWRADLINDNFNHKFDFKNCILNEVSFVRKELTEILNNELRLKLFEFDIPLIASYILSNSDSRQNLLKTAVEVRRCSSAKRFRKWLTEMQINIDNEKNLVNINEALKEIDDIVNDLHNELGKENNSKQPFIIKAILNPFNVYSNSSLEFNININLGWVDKMFNRKPHLTFLRKITKESLYVPNFIKCYQNLK